MADSQTPQQRPLLTQEQLKKKFEIKNFDLNAILRGAQLTIVGALRALQNPALFTSEHYKQALIAVAAGIAIRVAIAIPIIGIKVLLWMLSFVFDFESATWDDKLVGGLDFVQNYVLQVPFFLMTFMRHITPTLDNMFMDSLAWVDKTYQAKHKAEDPSQLRDMYYQNLRMYSTRDGSTHSKSTAEALTMMIVRLSKKAGLSLAIFALSYVPYVGRLVLPAASFTLLTTLLGLGQPPLFLLEPYFSRIRFTKEQKKHWFHDREGLLFGFGVGFYIFLRIPLLGVLIYGIAEASTAYLITKITDPPPPPAYSSGFAESQQRWHNKHDFLKLDWSELDASVRGDAATHSEIASNPLNTGMNESGRATAAQPLGPPPPYTELKSRYL